jgi:hypothetical protein
MKKPPQADYTNCPDAPKQRNLSRSTIQTAEALYSKPPRSKTKTVEIL